MIIELRVRYVIQAAVSGIGADDREIILFKETIVVFVIPTAAREVNLYLVLPVVDQTVVEEFQTVGGVQFPDFNRQTPRNPFKSALDD